MIVELEELGNRPTVWTKPRRFAPQAAHAMAQYLSAREFADKGFVVLDWEDVTGQLPSEAARPILYLQVVKAVPEIGQTVRIETRYDVDDIFSADSMTPTIIVDLIRGMEEAVEREVARRKEVSKGA